MYGRYAETRNWKVEVLTQHITGVGGLKELIAMIPRTVKRELQKILYYLPRVIGLLILGLIPGLNIFAAFIWVLFSGWMMAIQYIDYPADNHKMSFPEMRRYLSSHRFTSLGFGMITFGATLVPLLNFFAMPAAVCGAVAFWINEKQALGDINLDLNIEAQKKLNS